MVYEQGAIEILRMIADTLAQISRMQVILIRLQMELMRQQSIRVPDSIIREMDKMLADNQRGGR